MSPIVIMSRLGPFAAATLVALVIGCNRTAAAPDASTRDVVPSPDSTSVSDAAVIVDRVAPVDIADATDASGSYDRPPSVTVPPLERPDLTAFPRDDAGRPMLISVPGAELLIDETQRDPVFTLATCGALISGCVSPQRTLDACVVSAPICATSTPWTESALCCPAACRDRFESQRAAGVSAFDAFKQVYFDDPGCFPGVLELLGGRS